MDRKMAKLNRKDDSSSFVAKSRDNKQVAFGYCRQSDTGHVLNDRPALKRLIRDAQSGVCSAVIVEDMDRMARNSWTVTKRALMLNHYPVYLDRIRFRRRFGRLRMLTQTILNWFGFGR
jgi:hypothetical protein